MRAVMDLSLLDLEGRRIAPRPKGRRGRRKRRSQNETRKSLLPSQNEKPTLLRQVDQNLATILLLKVKG